MLLRTFQSIYQWIFQTQSEIKSGSSESQKILIVTQFYPPDFAATGQLVEELAHNLGQLGLTITVFTGQPGYAFQKAEAPREEVMAGVRVRRSRVARWLSHRIRGKAINSLLFCLRASLYLLQEARHHQMLLFTTAPPYLSFIGYVIYQLTGVPYACLVYDLYPDVAVSLSVVPETHRLVRLWRWLNQLIWRNAHHIIVLSSTMKDRVLEHCRDVSDRISVIHNWADPSWIIPCAKQENWFVQTHQLDQAFTVLYSGNLGRCHDVETILEAAKILKDDPVQFVFIGGGAQRAGFIQNVEAHQLSNCRFLPYQNRQTLPYSLTAGDLTLVSLRHGMEGLIAPSKVYSGLAAGCPLAIICEADSYLTELVAQAQCGRTVAHGASADLAEFIRYLASHPTQAAAMGAAGRRYLQHHFTPSRIARQYMEVLCFGGQISADLPPGANTEAIAAEWHIQPEEVPRPRV